MRFHLKTYLMLKPLRAASIFLLAVLTVSCGGSGSPAGTISGIPVGSSSSSTLKLALVDITGVTTNSVTAASPLTAKATVLDGSGKPVSGVIVQFGTGGNLTVVTPSSGATLTNSSGVATVTLSPKDLQTAQTQSGTADTLKAIATVGTSALSASAVYQMGATAVKLSLAAPGPGTTALSAYGTTSIKVDVLANGSLYTAEPITVNFSSGCSSSGHAVLPASATTVNGRAQVVYTDKGCGGIDVVTASFAGAQSITASLNVTAPVGASIGFVSGVPSDAAIVIKGAGGVGRSETATLTFKALDTSGQPLPNQLINFSVVPASLVTLQTLSAITDSSGLVVASVTSGTTATTFRVIASFAIDPSISTLSSAVTVTTGVPVQESVSLSVTSPNIEAWSIDNVTDTVLILLADAFGNPVADGTPVVFSTDSGAIGTSSNGGCVTTNGGCSVSFRSQNPRYGVGNTAGKRAGLATITATSTTAFTTISGQTAIFLSAGDASNVYFFGGVDPLWPSPTVNGLTTLGCGAYGFKLELNDRNFNPLPGGTALTVENASSDLTLGAIVPAAVVNVFPHDASGNGSLVVADMAPRQGSVHTISVTPSSTACMQGGLTTATKNFDIKIKSPAGKETLYSFSLTYPTP